VIAFDTMTMAITTKEFKTYRMQKKKKTVSIIVTMPQEEKQFFLGFFVLSD
jgi:hypothetical protein